MPMQQGHLWRDPLNSVENNNYKGIVSGRGRNDKGNGVSKLTRSLYKIDIGQKSR